MKHDHKPAPPPPPPCKHAELHHCEKCDAVECKACGAEWLGSAEVKRRVDNARVNDVFRGPITGKPQGPWLPTPQWYPAGDSGGWPPGTILCSHSQKG